VKRDLADVRAAALFAIRAAARPRPRSPRARSPWPGGSRRSRAAWG
jgi:hypothetical protein